MKKINLLFFLLLPFIEVATALTTRLTTLPVSIGIIIKGLYLLALTIYVVFYSKSKYKKNYIRYLIIVILFCLLYFITKIDLFNKAFIFKECTGLFKVFYPSLLFCGLMVLVDQYKVEDKNLSKIMFYSLLAYAFFLIIPTITHTNFSSYGEAYNNEGSLGWFYAANDTSAILLMLYPFIFKFLDNVTDNKNKLSYLYYLILIPVIYSVFIIGTKTSWFGLILINFILLGINIIRKEKKKSIITLSVVTLITILLTFISPVVTNMNKNIVHFDEINNNITELTPAQQKEIDVREACKFKDAKELFKNEKVYKVVDKVFSGRQNKAYTEITMYNSSNIFDRFFGVGLSITDRINNCNVERYVEIDILDIFIHYGLIGLTVVLAPFIYAFNFIYKNKKKISTDTIIYLSMTILMILISLMAGHIIGYPSSGIYLSIYLILMILSIKENKEK